MKKIDYRRDPVGYEQYIDDFARRARQRRQRNNSIPVIQERILRLLGAANGGRLKRSQLTGKLAKLGCGRHENRTKALRLLETAGKIRCEAGWSNGHRHDVWVLVQLRADDAAASKSLQPDG